MENINALMKKHNIVVQEINNKYYTYRNNDLKHIYDTFEGVKSYISILELIDNL